MQLRLATAALAAVLLTGLAGCSQPTGLMNVATSPAEDRSFDALKSDAGITFDINEVLLSEKYRDLYFDIDTDVYEGRVMLTGAVKTAADKQRATDLVRQVGGVREVINELQVTDEYTSSQQANDVWIETKLKAELIGAEGVHSINYRWRSVKGVVYLIGTARSQAELDKALDVIRGTARVQKVVNHAWVRKAKS